MAEVTNAAATGRRETVRFMRWGKGPGVEMFDREVEWARTVRARNRLVNLELRGPKRERDMTVFDDRLCPDPVGKATVIADETARRMACGPRRAFKEMEIQTFAESLDTPHLVCADGSLAAIPADWFIHDEIACDLWILACSQARRIEEPAVRLDPIVIAADVVWSSHREDAINERRLAAFAEAAQASMGAEAELKTGPSPGM